MGVPYTTTDIPYMSLSLRHARVDGHPGERDKATRLDSCERRHLRNLLSNPISCHSERSEESKVFGAGQHSLVDRDFRFLTSLRFVRNDSVGRPPLADAGLCSIPLRGNSLCERGGQPETTLWEACPLFRYEAGSTLVGAA